MKPSISIHPKEACECAHPIKERSYRIGSESFWSCKLCGFLIPRSRMERIQLREAKHRLEVAEGTWPSAQSNETIDRVRAQELVEEALEADSHLTNGQLRDIVGGHGKILFGNTVWTVVCRDARQKLAIMPRKGRRPNCIVLGCVNPCIGVHGYCKKHFGVDQVA